MREVVLVDGMRTAFGKRGGSLKEFSGSQLAVLVAKGLLKKTQLLERGAKPDTILCGSALLDSGTSTPARYVALGCGLEDTIADEGSALGHKFNKYTSNNDATCEQDGTKTATCANGCGKKETVTDEGTALGHKFNKYTANNDATCEQDATESAICANGCGTTDTITIEGTAKGHNYERKAWESDKDNHWKSCDCGEKFNVTAHTGKLVGAVDATEEAEGYTGDTVCEVCDYEIAKGEVIPVLEKPVNVVVIVIIVVVVAAIGVGAYLVIAKKKKQQL